jgi:hypothetical protein
MNHVLNVGDRVRYDDGDGRAGDATVTSVWLDTSGVLSVLVRRDGRPAEEWVTPGDCRLFEVLAADQAGDAPGGEAALAVRDRARAGEGA